MDPEDFANLVALLGLNFSQSQGTSTGFFESPFSTGMGSLLGGFFGTAGANIGGKVFPA